MRSLSNLVKSAFVTEKDDESRVIDSNEMVAERLRVLTEQMEAQLQADGEDYSDEFIEGLDPEQVEELLADREKGSQESADAQARIEEAQAELERLSQQADEVIADAKSQADSIIAQANEEAKQIEETARSQGHDEGYQAGYDEGMRKVREAEESLEARKAELESEYEKKFAEMEPQLMDALCSVYREVFGVDMTGRSDTVVFLLRKAMQFIEGGTNFLVHVSSDDYAYASEHKEELRSLVGPAGTLELIEDHTLSQGQSYIETESGIFDCSFGVEMELLSKELKLLSRSEF